MNQPQRAYFESRRSLTPDPSTELQTGGARWSEGGWAATDLPDSAVALAHVVDAVDVELVRQAAAVEAVRLAAGQVTGRTGVQRKHVDH